MKHKHLFMRYPEGREKALTFSFDDGVEQDIWFAALLRANGMKGTFNVNAGLIPEKPVDRNDPALNAFQKIQRRMTVSQLKTLFSGNYMECATHGYTHAQLEALDHPSMLWELMIDRMQLEALTGIPVVGHAYPMGTFSEDAAKGLAEAGLQYGRTTRATHSFTQPKNWLLLDPTAHYADREMPDLVGKFLSQRPEQTVNSPAADPWLFYIWGHTYEFEAYATWHYVEELIKKLAGRRDVWYCTNIEARRYTAAFDGLQFSLDRSTVYNPSALDVWGCCDGGTVVHIPAGKITTL